jgi:hypothetical protein
MFVMVPAAQEVDEEAAREPHVLVGHSSELEFAGQTYLPASWLDSLLLARRSSWSPTETSQYPPREEQKRAALSPGSSLGRLAEEPSRRVGHRTFSL